MKKMLITILTSVILLLCIGLSYAYFTGMIFGSGKKLSVTSANLRILFTDSQELSNLEIEPGWNESKTFSVKNESEDTFNYNIVFENLVNTFVTEGFLQYKITSSNGYNMEGYLDIPKSNTSTDAVLAYDIDIPKDTTHEYTIEFVYLDSETVDQSDDMGKELSGNLAITEGTINPDIKYTVTMNSDNGTITPESNQTVKKGNLEFEVTPNTGYDISTMSVSCTPVANTVITDNKIKVNDIRQDHDCIVSFDKETYTVNIVVNNGESDALNKKVEYGESGAAKITPNKGYTLSGATVEGTGCSIEGEVLSISNVVSNGTCTVTLPRDKYTVTLTGVGIEASDSPKTVEYEGETTINFTLSEGYELGSNVINCDNGYPSLNGSTLTVSNIIDNTICTLTPTLKSYEVTLVVNGGTPASEIKTIEHNGSGTYTITNDTGYNLELDGSISCTGSASGTFNSGTVTISGVTTTQTCTVNLKKEEYTVTVTVSGGTSSPTSMSIPYNESRTGTISASTGYDLSNATVTGTGCTLSSDKKSLTISNVTSTRTCKITIPKYTYTVSVSSNNTSYGTVSVDKSSVEYGGSVNITISAKNGYKYSTHNCGGTKNGNIIILSNITSNKSCTVTFASSGILLVNKLKSAYPPKTGRTDFSVIDNGTPALYTGADDQGTTYYFSGDGSTMNNWVLFAGKMWRIIRINGNGSVRLLYAGDGNDATDIGSSAFNSTNNHPQYVGWKYTSGDSLSTNRQNGTKSVIYSKVETWYNGLSTANKNYVDTNAIYCNARNIGSGIYGISYAFQYTAYRRLVTNKAPIFTCSDTSDRFNTFGLMTADEVAYAGGVNGIRNDKAYYYLAKDGTSSITGSNYWWTMSPYYYNRSSSAFIACMFSVYGSSIPGNLAAHGVSISNVVRPVISLKSNTLVSGTGSATDPYVVRGLQ